MSTGLDVGALAVLGGVIALRSWLSPTARARRALRRIPATATRDAADGCMVKLVGTVEPLGEMAVTPVSRRYCLYYLVVVEETTKKGRQEIWRESNYIDFILRDATGTAIVRMHDAVVATEWRYRWRTKPFLKPPPEVESFIGLGKTDFWDAPQRRLTELALGPVQEIAVRGMARWELDESVNYRQSPRRLVLESTPGQPLLIAAVKR
jgi:hypothetical protein